MNPETLSVISLVLSVAAVGTLLVLWKRVAVLRRRAKRSLYIGPEPHLRLQKQVYDRAARLEAARRGWEPPIPIEFRSEWGEDTLLFDLFEGQETGVYIEAGALDGHENSVTWIFEALGWSGLLVEAIPERAEQCRTNRPGSRVVHAALDSNANEGFIEFNVPENSQFDYWGHRSDRSTEHLRSLMERDGVKIRSIQVPRITLTSALDEHGFEHVDFAVLDVEGTESDALKGFDLDRFRPRTLVIEDNSLGDESELDEILIPAGYSHAMWIGVNRVYIRTDDERLIARAHRLAETVYSPMVRPIGAKDTADGDLRKLSRTPAAPPPSSRPN